MKATLIGMRGQDVHEAVKVFVGKLKQSNDGVDQARTAVEVRRPHRSACVSGGAFGCANGRRTGFVDHGRILVSCFHGQVRPKLEKRSDCIERLKPLWLNFRKWKDSNL